MNRAAESRPFELSRWSLEGELILFPTGEVL
jgi:hypothetical protein